MIIAALTGLLALAGIAHACVPDRSNNVYGGGAAVWCSPANVDYYGYFLPMMLNQCSQQQVNPQSPDTFACEESTRSCQKRCNTNSDCVTYYGDDRLQQPCLDQWQTNQQCYGYSPETNGAHIVKFCGCYTADDCPNKELCVIGVCRCAYDFNCGRAQICIQGQRSWNEIGQNGAFTERSSYGECACDLANPSASCNGNGVCVRRQDDNNIAHSTWQRVPSGGMVHSGVCKCYKGWAGRFCQDNVVRRTRCNGHGVALCNREQSSNFRSVVSRYTGVSFGLYECDYTSVGWQDDWNSAPKPGEPGCQCDPGFYPDVSVSSTGHCAQLLPCDNGSGAAAGTVQIDGYCRCFSDFYDARYIDQTLQPTPGHCVPGCAQTICSGHGTCIPTAGSNTQFNAACQCDAGWTNSPLTERDKNAFVSLFEQKRYCDIPYELINGQQVLCGFYGQIDQIALHQCSLKPEYASVASEFRQDLITGLWFRSCPVPVTGPFTGLQCTGALFGQCVADGHGGFQCKCNNGFTGSDCRTRTCPTFAYVNGDICSGNGFCDNATPTSPEQGRCICKPGYFGDACERRAIDCAQSQPVYTFQSQQASIPDLLSQLASQ